MENIMNSNLAAALHNYTVTVMKESNPYLTKQAISRKVLQECADILMIDLNCYMDKNSMYIHTDNMEKIDAKWENLIAKGVKILHDEHNAYKIMKSSDVVNIIDLQKFITILAGKDQEEFLSQLLAMDGFRGITDNKNYIENLKIGDKGNSHVQIVRLIYKTFKVPVKVVYLALLKVYENYTNDDEMKQLINNTIRDFEDDFSEYDIQGIMEMYEHSVQDIEIIALTKLAQLKNRSKKLKGVKRKLRVSLKEAKKSKPLEKEDEDD